MEIKNPSFFINFIMEQNILLILSTSLILVSCITFIFLLRLVNKLKRRVNFLDEERILMGNYLTELTNAHNQLVGILDSEMQVSEEENNAYKLISMSKPDIMGLS